MASKFGSKRKICRTPLTTKSNGVHTAAFRGLPEHAIELAVRRVEKLAEHNAQHGKVKIIMKDGVLIQEEPNAKKIIL